MLYINNQYAVTDILLNDGLWHHLCVTWEHSKGKYNIYIDGSSVKSGNGLAKSTTIEGNGNMIVGQEQDIVGGRFSQSETYLGKMAYIDVWSKELTQNEIKFHMDDCNEKSFGDLYNWIKIQDNVQGNIKIENSTFCQKCQEPKPLYNGIIDTVENVAYYDCYKGYYLSNASYSRGRKCTKASTWEGFYEPFCKSMIISQLKSK